MSSDGAINGKRRATAFAGLALALGLTAAGATARAAEPEVCMTTEYQGCPERWLYEWSP